MRTTPIRHLYRGTTSPPVSDLPGPLLKMDKDNQRWVDSRLPPRLWVWISPEWVYGWNRFHRLNWSVGCKSSSLPNRYYSTVGCRSHPFSSKHNLPRERSEAKCGNGLVPWSGFSSCIPFSTIWKPLLWSVFQHHVAVLQRELLSWLFLVFYWGASILWAYLESAPPRNTSRRIGWDAHPCSWL